jgi:hypothetical protein
MKSAIASTAAIAIFCATTAAQQPSVLQTETATTLWDKLLDTTVQHIKTSGPDADVAQFISMTTEAAWRRREEMVAILTPYLGDQNPKNVAGALATLVWFRGHRPMGGIGDVDERFRKEHAVFFAGLDQSVHARLDHFHRLNDGKAFHSLALYLGNAPSKEAKRELLRLARETSAKGQALICLAWHRDPEDMNDLLPFMLEDSQAAPHLPYHFRNSYGKAALPHLKQALTEGKNRFTREQAAKELGILEQSK